MLRRDKALCTEGHVQNHHLIVIHNNYNGSDLESMCKLYLGSILLLAGQAMHQRIPDPKMGLNIEKEDSHAFRSLRSSPETTVDI